MSVNVLVAFASKHGATGEIATGVVQGLREGGLRAELRRAEEVADIGPYDAVVLGSAVYMGKWQAPAREFLKRFERELRVRPTWLFSSGPTGGSPDADAKVAASQRLPEAVPAPGEIAKRAPRIGDDMTGMLERWMPRGDWRDFDQVKTWGRKIAIELSHTN
jgi:menaquinone-dependent protoporphyrinogen oxidase